MNGMSMSPVGEFPHGIVIESGCMSRVVSFIAMLFKCGVHKSFFIDHGRIVM